MWRALLILLWIGVAHADGFDHNVHARDVEVGGGEAVPCAHCHELKAGRLVGKPGHAACFGTCHGPAPHGVKPTAQLCTNCHAAGTAAVPYPPYKIDRDFSLSIGHKQHVEIACTECHDPIAKQPPVPHARCAGCHDGTQRKGRSFAMTSCAACHPRAVGVPQPPELKTVRDSVTSIFSHATHAARGGKDCALCHAKIKDATENDIQLPRPTAKDCEHCHDGKQAFPVTAACTKCHAEPKGPFKVDRPQARFRHDKEHAVLVGGEPCTTCHVLDKSGETAIAGHNKCTQCHADDFGDRHPKKCGACHSATEPWRHLRADRGLPDTTEFGATLDHAKHTGACTTCHALRTATTQLRTPRGHTSCVGSGCHAATTGALPHLDDCNACHRLGLAASRHARVIGAPWSVATAFDHVPHEKDAAGTALACTSCHTALAGPVLTLATPAKATCAPCHDGVRSFKLTGTTCRRCHQGGS